MSTRRVLDVLSRNVRTAGLSVAVIVGLAAGGPHLLVAQSSEQADGLVKVGDRWVYEIRDESTGYLRDGYTEMVTEVSPREIILNRTFREPGSGSSTSEELAEFSRKL
jgi:hypothetical protein